MDDPTWPPAPDVAHPRIIAANGPRMLALAGDMADGALPALLPPKFTTQARRTLGPDKLLVVGVEADSHPDATATKVDEHLTAGADHVTLLLPIGGEFKAGVDQLEQLAPRLSAVRPARDARPQGSWQLANHKFVRVLGHLFKAVVRNRAVQFHGVPMSLVLVVARANRRVPGA